MTKVVPAAAAALILLASMTPLSASCRRSGGFAIYQCGDGAYFDAPPPGTGAVTALLWQLGYGNSLTNNGDGSNGAGIAPAGVFSGNDSGLFRVGLVDARAALRDPRVPDGAICLGPANWGSIGFDGCCDNARDPNLVSGMDGLLNPEFDPRELNLAKIFIAAPERVQDYPMAVLLRDETGSHFAAAAIGTMKRATLEDVRVGHYSFGDVTEGVPNARNGARNVIPWQRVPDLRLEVAGPGTEHQWRVRATWQAASVAGDGSHRPSEAYGIDNPGHGVGVADMGPLVAYHVERAHLSQAFISEEGYALREALSWERVATTSEPAATLEIAEDDCLRAVVDLGLPPRTTAVSGRECSLGRCGDVGYSLAGLPMCLEGPVLRAAAFLR